MSRSLQRWVESCLKAMGFIREWNEFDDDDDDAPFFHLHGNLVPYISQSLDNIAPNSKCRSPQVHVSIGSCWQSSVRTSAVSLREWILESEHRRLQAPFTDLHCHSLISKVELLQLSRCKFDTDWPEERLISPPWLDEASTRQLCRLLMEPHAITPPLCRPPHSAQPYAARMCHLVLSRCPMGQQLNLDFQSILTRVCLIRGVFIRACM